MKTGREWPLIAFIWVLPILIAMILPLIQWLR